MRDGTPTDPETYKAMREKASQLTPAQRSFLERISKCSEGSSMSDYGLVKMGLVRKTRDSSIFTAFYAITKAGRAALKQGGP